MSPGLVIRRLSGAVNVLLRRERPCAACAARAADPKPDTVRVSAREARALVDRVEHALDAPRGLVRDAEAAQLNLLEWACDLERMSRDIDWATIEHGGWPT